MTTPDAPRLKVTDLAVRYDRVPALAGVSFTARAGEVVGVCGPNGSGKSTLLRAIVGLVPTVSGTVRVGGQPFARVPREVSYVPQDAAIDRDFPITVREVVATGRMAHRRGLRWPRRVDREIVDDALAQLGLTGLADRGLAELSGGQRQRAFLARALAQQARIVLLDEPFAAVDAVTEHELWQRLRGLARDGALVLVVHHDLASLADAADRLLLLSGRLVADGAPSEALAPARLEAAYGLPLQHRPGSGGNGAAAAGRAPAVWAVAR